MKTVLLALTLITLQFATVEGQWINKKTTPPAKADDSTQAQDSSSWFVQADYLYWKAFQEDLYYGSKGDSGGSQSGVFLNLKPLQPNFGWNSGVRVGIGGYTAERWDISAKATYIYSSAEKTATGNANLEVARGFPQNGSFIFPSWVSQILGFGKKATALWKNNFFIYDFLLGREYNLAHALSVHPFFGVRGFTMYQTYRCFYNSGYNGHQFFFSDLGKIALHTTTFGVGPRLGVDLGYRVAANWSLVGGFSGSLLYSHYKMHQKINAFVNEGGMAIPFKGTAKDSSDMGRTNLDAYVGLNWIKSFNKEKNRITIGVLFESSYWFGLNQFFDFYGSELGEGSLGAGQDDELTFLNTSKRHGDLSYMGGTLRFQFDF